MLVAEPSPPCATSWTCPGPNATASRASSRLRPSLRPPGTGYCSTGLPSARANDPDAPPWSCQSVSWPPSQASSQTSQAFDRCSGRYQRTSGSCTTRSAQNSGCAAILTVTARSWAGDKRPVRGTRPCSVSTIACWRSGLTPHPCLRPVPTRSGCSAPALPGVMMATDTRPPKPLPGEMPSYAWVARASPDATQVYPGKCHHGPGLPARYQAQQAYLPRRQPEPGLPGMAGQRPGPQARAENVLDVLAARPVRADRADDLGQPPQHPAASGGRGALGQRAGLVGGQQLAGGDDMSVVQGAAQRLGGLPVEGLHVLLAAGGLDEADRGRNGQPAQRVDLARGALVHGDQPGVLAPPGGQLGGQAGHPGIE